jgi:hypothetical protein
MQLGGQQDVLGFHATDRRVWARKIPPRASTFG